MHCCIRIGFRQIRNILLRGCGLPHQSADWFAMTQKYDAHCADPGAPGFKLPVIPRNFCGEESVSPAAEPLRLPPGGKLSKIEDF